jgi:hypothetical protein
MIIQRLRSIKKMGGLRDLGTVVNDSVSMMIELAAVSLLDPE